MLSGLLVFVNAKLHVHVRCNFACLHCLLYSVLQVELPPADLGPTASLTQTLSLLREVLASHDSSVVPLDARQADFAQVSVIRERKLLLVEPIIKFQCGNFAMTYWKH